MSRDKVAKILDSERSILLMVFSACIYATFKDSWRLFADIFQTFLLLVSLVTLIVHWSFFKKEKLLWLLPVALIAQLSSWLYSLHFYPELATESPQVGRLLEFFVFFFIAFWLRGNEKYIWAMLTCFVFGSIFTLNYHSPLLEEISVGLSGKRVDFDYRNAQHGALIIGASILILIYFFIKNLKLTQRRTNLILINVFILTFLFLIQIIMQTRQALLGITAAIIIAIIYSCNKKNKVGIKTLIAATVTGTIIISIEPPHNIILQRLIDEFNIVSDYIISGNLSEIPYTSVGIRIQLWIESAMWICRSPILGFSNGIEAFIIEHSSRLAYHITVEFKHVHNSYIATLLRFGLLGLLLGFAILIFPIIDLFKSTKGKEHIQHIKYLAIMFLVYWLVVNTFESFWYMKAGLWTYTVFMAAIYTIPLSQRYEKYQASLKR